MEHSFADLLGAFSDTSLPCYQEAELDFEPLNLEEGSGDENGNGVSGRLPALTEADEEDDPEEEEDTGRMSGSASEEEPGSGRSESPRDEGWGVAVNPEEGQEFEDEEDMGAEDTDSAKGEDAGGFRSPLDIPQKISLGQTCLEGDRAEDEEDTGRGSQTQDEGKDIGFSTRESDSEEDDGLEFPRVDALRGDSDSESEGEEEEQRELKEGRRFSAPLSFQNLKEGEERPRKVDVEVVTETDSESDADTGSDSDVVVDTDVAIDADTYAVMEVGSDSDVDGDTGADAVVDIDVAVGVSVVTDSDIAVRADRDAEVDEGIRGFAGLRESPDPQDPYLSELQEEPFRGEMKEFSEADYGGIGEGYAEYPTEEEEHEHKEIAEEDFGTTSGQHLESRTEEAEGELSDWELMGKVEGFEKQESGEMGLEEGSEEEEEMEVSESCRFRGMGDADEVELVNEAGKVEFAGIHENQPRDWTQDDRSDSSDERHDGSDDEILSKVKFTGEEWERGGKEDLKQDVRQMQASADDDDILHSLRQERVYVDEEGALRCIKQVQAFVDEEDALLGVRQEQVYNYDEDVPHGLRHEEISPGEVDIRFAELEDGKVNGGSGGRNGAGPGGRSPRMTTLSISSSDRSSRDSESESSLSDLEPWPDRAASLRDLITRPPGPQPYSASQEEDATELLSGTMTHIDTAILQRFGHMEEEEEEEEEDERNWEQEQERIQAFYRYYNDDDEEENGTGAQGQSRRKLMVRFCLDPPPQQDSDSSDTDADVVSSSSEGTDDLEPEVIHMGTGLEDLDSAVTGMEDLGPIETRLFARTEVDEERDSNREKFSLLLQQSQVTQSELTKLSAELRARRQRKTEPSMLRSAMKMCLVSVLGVIMFWWATDQLDWTMGTIK